MVIVSPPDAVTVAVTVTMLGAAEVAMVEDVVADALDEEPVAAA